ncbi:hypothetical protein, partial [Tabrizicola sp.]|uniref:hypothetical protein n=1 Tax=Tabrizicola sp. TaxID=2005166 RepID=UPI00286BF09E
MSDLNLHFNSAENDDVALAKAINRRAYGWWQWQLPTLASVLAFAIAAVPAVVATAGPSLLTLWLMPCFAFVVARDLSTRVLKRHLRSRVSASPINRPRQTNLALTAEGLSDDMMRVPWSFVTGQFRLSHMTIV